MTISNLERDFVLKAISSGIRLDNRSFNQYRELNFDFSKKCRGSLILTLGGTRYCVS